MSGSCFVRSTMRSRLLFAGAALLAVVLGPAVLLWGDTITYRSGEKTAPITVEGTIMGAEKGDLIFTTQAGRRTQRPLDNVVQITLKSDPKFSEAEQAYAVGKFDEAANAYARVLDNTTQDWIRTRATLRLVDAANKSGQFAPAVRGYIELVKTDLPAATKVVPTIPKDKPDQANAAIAEVDRALAGSLQPQQKEALTTYKIKLLLAANRKAEADKILLGSGAAAVPGSAASGTASPTQTALSAERALLVAGQQLQGRNYEAAINTIESAKTSLTEAPQQAKALWYLAQAKEGLAGNDSTKLEDAAIAYMRIVAHFEDDKAANANVPQALMRTAAIEERLNHPQEAGLIYQQIVKDPKYEKLEVAAEAAKRAAALKAKG